MGHGPGQGNDARGKGKNFTGTIQKLFAYLEAIGLCSAS